MMTPELSPLLRLRPAAEAFAAGRAAVVRTGLGIDFMVPVDHGPIVGLSRGVMLALAEPPSSPVVAANDGEAAP